MKEFSIYLYGPNQGPLPLDFETLAARLQSIPRLFFEYDGSWVWRDNDALHGNWQLDGVVYDANGQIQYIDIKGRCPASIWDRLLQSIASNHVQSPNKTDQSSAQPLTPYPLNWCVLKLPEQELKGLEEFHQETWFSIE